MTQKLICLDVETTGFSNEHDRIVEIGCVDITHGWEKRTVFQKYINPKRPVPQSVIAVHGLDGEFLQQFQPIEVHIEEFLQYIEGAQLIIHNATFDIGFLNAELTRHGFAKLQNNIIDTLKLARELLPGKKASLDALKNYYEINIARKYHGALLDSEILAHVYIAMQNKQTALEVKQLVSHETATPSTALFSLNSEDKKNQMQLLGKKHR